MRSRQIAKIGLVSQADAGAALAPTSAFPFAPSLCSVHSFTACWTRFLRSIPAAGAASTQPVQPVAPACRAWAGSPRCSVIWRPGSNVLNNRKGRPRLSSVTPATIDHLHQRGRWFRGSQSSVSQTVSRRRRCRRQSCPRGRRPPRSSTSPPNAVTQDTPRSLVVEPRWWDGTAGDLATVIAALGIGPPRARLSAAEFSGG